jgi:hypothetical protein
MDVRKRLSLASMVLAGTTSTLPIIAAAQSMSGPTPPGAMQERSILVWSPPDELASIIIKIWDPQPHLKREPNWTPQDPATLLDGDDTNGVTGRGQLVWRQTGAADYDISTIDTIYEGDLVSGRPQGFGEQSDASGARYRGQWREGLPNGQGELLLSSGDQYRGEFWDGKFHGCGEYVSASGKVFSGRFERGAFVDGQQRLLFENYTPSADTAGIHESSEHIGDSGIESGHIRAVRSDVGDIEFKVYTDRKRYRTELDWIACYLGYDHRINDRELIISVADMAPVEAPETRILKAWKGDGRIDESLVCEEYGEMPAYLVGDITNNSQDILSVERGYLKVSESVADLQPFPVVSTSFGAAGVGYGCGYHTESIDDRIVIDNYGWGRIENARTSIRFSSRRQSAAEQSRVIHVELGSFRDYQTIRVFPLLTELGVRTGELHTRGRRCPSRSALPKCIRDVARSGIFGELANHLYSVAEVADPGALAHFAATDVVGVLTYDWIDTKGQRRTHRSPYRVIIPIYGFEIVEDLECGAVGPVTYAERVIRLPLNRTNYQVNFDLPPALRVLRPRQNTRFGLDIDSKQSATHAFEIVLELSDGRKVVSLPVDLNIFKLRTNKSYTQNPHFKISVLPYTGE